MTDPSAQAEYDRLVAHANATLPHKLSIRGRLNTARNLGLLGQVRIHVAPTALSEWSLLDAIDSPHN